MRQPVIRQCEHPDCNQAFSARFEKRYCSITCARGHIAIRRANGDIRLTNRGGIKVTEGVSKRDEMRDIIICSEFNRACDKWLESRGLKKAGGLRAIINSNFVN